MNLPASPEPAPETPARRDPLVSVVVVNYDAWPDVVALVSALASSPEVAGGLCEVVLVDNASDGPIPPVLRTPAPGVRLVRRGENGGFAVGVNSGWRAARAPWLLLLNPDVVAAPGFLARVVARVRRFESDRERTGVRTPGVVGFGLRNPDGSHQPSVGAFPSLARTVREQLIPRSRRKYQSVWRTRPGPVDWVTGACMLVSAAMLDEVGGMDEDFFLYYEEVALCRSARSRGWRVEYDPTVEVVHLRPLQNRPLTPKMRVITRHSKLLYFRKHLPRWQFLALCGVVAVEAKLSGAWARLRGRAEEVRAWETIGRVTRALREGASIGGRQIRSLVEALVNPAPLLMPGKGPTGKRRRTIRARGGDHPVGERLDGQGAG